MAYQVRRQKEVSEDIELIGKDGQVAKVIHVEFSPEKLARSFNSARNDIIRAQLDMKKGSTGKKLTAFGDAIIKMFKVVFGEENTDELIEFFENNYVEMAEQIMPFITDVAAPAITASVSEHKKQLATNYHLTREQRRKLGI